MKGYARTPGAATSCRELNRPGARRVPFVEFPHEGETNGVRIASARFARDEEEETFAASHRARSRLPKFESRACTRRPVSGISARRRNERRPNRERAIRAGRR